MIRSGNRTRWDVGLKFWLAPVALCVGSAWGAGEGPDGRAQAQASGGESTPGSGKPLIPPPRPGVAEDLAKIPAQGPGKPVIPPPRRIDQELARTLGQPPDQKADSAPSTAPDLTVPAADRPIGGGEPVEAEVAAEAAAAPAAQGLLMRALKLDDAPFKMYGWIQNSYTYNANGRGNGLNFGVNPNNLADQWMGNQYYLVVENTLEQNDKVNFGFRIDQLFGNDWQFNYMQGLFNGAFPPHHFAGYDLSQLYGEVHLPILTKGGLDVKGGLWYTLAGYEQVPATARPLLSVPYMFNYGQPFRHVGVVTTLHLTDRINLFNGSINGWDRWINQNYLWGYIGGFTWASKSGKTNVAFTCVWGPNQFPRFLPGNQPIYPTGYVNIPSLAGRVNPGYATNDRTLFTTVVTHKWTDKLTQIVESDQGWEMNVPGLASNGANGASKTAEWFSFGNWFLYQFHPKVAGVWRSEIFWDPSGARTGYADTYQEMTVGMVYKPKDYIWVRPELRYDWAQFGTPYSNGTRNSQFTIGLDMIFLF